VVASNQIAAGKYSITTIEVKGFAMLAEGVGSVDLNGDYTRKVTASTDGAPHGFYFENQDQGRSVRIIRNPAHRQWQFIKADDPSTVYAKSDSDKWDQYMTDEPMLKNVASTTDQNWLILQEHETFTDALFVTITSEDAALVVQSEGEQKQDLDLRLEDLDDTILELDLEGQLVKKPPRIVVKTFLGLYSVPPRNAQQLQKFPSETTSSDTTPRRNKFGLEELDNKWCITTKESLNAMSDPQRFAYMKNKVVVPADDLAKSREKLPALSELPAERRGKIKFAVPQGSGRARGRGRGRGRARGRGRGSSSSSPRPVSPPPGLITQTNGGGSSSSSSSGSSSSSSSNGGIFGQLKELAEMKKNGLLTDAEFAQAKKLLLEGK
jgi:hypothetical protein